MRKSENEAPELNDEKNEEVNTEKDDWLEEMPESRAANKTEETVSCSNEDATNISFSDGDEDMNVDFDMDMDTDEDTVRNDEDGDPNGSPATPLIPDVTKQDNDSSDTEKNNSSPSKHPSVPDLDIDSVNNVEKTDRKKGGEQNNWMDVDSGSSSGFLNTGKINLVFLDDSQGITKVSRTHHLRTMNVCTKFCANPSRRFQTISVNKFKL